ncbi:hypothetical protein P1X14_02400 [Sphingomonas sp. AOB5]|uniref:DUF2946 family protein n=1 Tax=Sphingomonas sp. AOB5 TaxID=3034017 RepID=UPI0023F9F7D8|nr:DUF2946 family protein [Sphingomonas sp. AOB5]MDF7774085.1 hypothetical protein [Sphingomonas sp. AOB5]
MIGVIRTGGRVRSLFAAMFALALLVRIAVPAGFMPVATAQGIVVTICDAVNGGKTMVVDLGNPDVGGQQSDHQQKAESCAFAGMSAPALGTGAPPLLAERAMLLREFALAPPADFAPGRADYLTPPLRGPPALA